MIGWSTYNADGLISARSQAGCTVTLSNAQLEMQRNSATDDSRVAVLHVVSQPAPCQGEIEWTVLSPQTRPVFKVCFTVCT